VEDKVTLWIDNNTCWYENQYPFLFRLEVTYEVCENQIRLKTVIYNNSSVPMPHAFGWHPYFKASDKSRLQLDHEMTVRYDYENCADLEMPEKLDLAEWWDDVFHTSKSRTFTLKNPADGYEVQCTSDEAFPVMVVCT